MIGIFKCVDGSATNYIVITQITDRGVSPDMRHVPLVSVVQWVEHPRGGEDSGSNPDRYTLIRGEEMPDYRKYREKPVRCKHCGLHFIVGIFKSEKTSVIEKCSHCGKTNAVTFQKEK